MFFKVLSKQIFTGQVVSSPLTKNIDSLTVQPEYSKPFLRDTSMNHCPCSVNGLASLLQRLQVVVIVLAGRGREDEDPGGASAIYQIHDYF